jgi:hypothetical protein
MWPFMVLFMVLSALNVVFCARLRESDMIKAGA